MTDLLRHRGPDDVGYAFVNSQTGRAQTGRHGFVPSTIDVGLSNRRLAIIDLSETGAQPMVNESAEIFCVFNGEIFNYIELRRNLLARGHVFRSNSDSEVIVHAYEEWGVDCVKRFNGMWAFAIWDQQRRRFFCSRDRFGIKPLYYFLSRDSFVFGSEIKAILPALAQGPRPDRQVIRRFLIDGMLGDDENTFFAEIRRLEPARNLIVTSSDFQALSYWDYHTRSEEYGMKNPVETFRNLFDESVRLRLRSDVPVGVALSGGLDSTSVMASTVKSGYNHDLKAFTAVFPGKDYDEYRHARAAADFYGAELFCIEYWPDRFLDDLRKVVWFLDYPAQEGQVILRWRLMELASRHVKVMLEGQGADEMLAGYPWRYAAPFFKDEMRRLHLVNVIRMLVRKHRHTYRATLRRWMRWVGLSGRFDEESTLPESPYTEEFSGIDGVEQELTDRLEFSDRLTEMMHRDHASHVLPKLLKYGDAMSMASSVESRLPFLDHRLVEFVFQLPYFHKYDGRVSKGILRHAMQEDLPGSILARRDKVGFATPLPEWIDASLQTEIRPLLMDPRSLDRGILDRGRLDRFLDSTTGCVRPDAAFDIFRWVSVELWFQTFIDAPQAAK